MKRLRLFLGILILAISLTVLIWSYWPAARETRVQPISPSEMQLPTPSSLYFDGTNASLSPPIFVL